MERTEHGGSANRVNGSGDHLRRWLCRGEGLKREDDHMADASTGLHRSCGNERLHRFGNSHWRIRPVVIQITKLRRAHRQIKQFCDELEAAYPGEAATLGNESNDWSETIRNAFTTLGHIRPWIDYRERHRRDPRATPKE